jgi:hypothetical protein
MLIGRNLPEWGWIEVSQTSLRKRIWRRSVTLAAASSAKEHRISRETSQRQYAPAKVATVLDRHERKSTGENPKKAPGKFPIHVARPPMAWR